jgi:glycosyltransferase involved in cell wall biosynthesis
MAISVIVLTFNSESTIARTVQSAARVTDDIHVVDSSSTDSTLEILEKLPVKVVQHPFENYGAQRNWAIDNLPLRHSWQLHLDADEYLTNELIGEINTLKEAFPEEVDGFLIPRKICFLNRMLEHGGLYPKWHMRLFRSGKARCETRRYDQHFILSGKAARLRHPMIDDHKMSLSEWTARHNRWADLEVEEVFSPQVDGIIQGDFSGGTIERRRALRHAYYRLPHFARAFLLFFHSYFLRLGFLDGMPGLIYITLQVFWYRFLIDAKCYERKITKR